MHEDMTEAAHLLSVWKQREAQDIALKGTPPPAIHFLHSGPTYHSFHQLPGIYPILSPAVDEFRHSWPVSDMALGTKPLMHEATF